jgi:hypothetical protein
MPSPSNCALKFSKCHDELVSSPIFNLFESEFKSYHDDLDLVAKDVRLQISLASKQADRETAKLLEDDRKENAGHWRLALTFQKAVQTEYAEQQQCRLRKAGGDSGKMRSEIRANISTIDQVKPWKQAIQQRAPDTASWFQNDATFRDWEHDKCTALLRVSGTLGMGKTVLVSNIIAYLHTVRNGLYIMSYFFCRWDREESLRARNILGSIARQLLNSLIEHATDNIVDRPRFGGKVLQLGRCQLNRTVRARYSADKYQENADTREMLTPGKC